jgi:predicted MFS family arabinose efflux permease
MYNPVVSEPPASVGEAKPAARVPAITSVSTTRTWATSFSVTLLAMMCLQVSNLGFSPLIPAIQQEFRLSFSQVGFFAGMYGLISIFVSIPAGLLIRKIGEKTALTGGLFVVALGLAWLSTAGSQPAAFGARALWLSGYRFAFIAVMTAIALSCPPSVRGRSMGVLGAIAALGSVVGAPMGSVVARDFGWRNGVLAYAGVAAIGGIVFLSWYRSRDAGDREPASSTNSASAPFRNPVVWAVALLSGLAGVTSLATNAFLPSALKAVFHLDAVAAASVISTGFAWAIALNLTFGFLMDRLNRSVVLGGVALLLMSGSLLMVSRDLVWFRLGAVGVLALGHAAIQQSYALAADVLRGRQIGNVMGIVGGVAGIVNYLTPQTLGILRDHSGGFDAGWYFLAAISGMTFLLVVLLRRHSKILAG